MEREVGGGIGMGNTCKPLAVSFQCMTKSTTNKKKKKKEKKKENIYIKKKNVLLTNLGLGVVKNHSRDAWNLSEERCTEKIFVFALLKSTNPNEKSGDHGLYT